VTGRPRSSWATMSSGMGSCLSVLFAVTAGR
jgi:hypothetical protein